MLRRLLILVLFLAAPLLALDVPPKPQAWVEDHAHVFTDAQRQALNEKLENFFRASGARLIVVTMASLEGEDVTAFTNRAVNTWKLKDKNDRVAVMFIFPSDRKYWLQVGYGLEGVLTDAVTSGVYRSTIVPNFKAGRYYEGVDEALNRLAHEIAPDWTPPSPAAVTRAPRNEGGRAVTPQFGAGDIIKLVFLLIFIFIVVVPLMRRGGCGGCIGCFPWFPFGGGGMTFGGGGWGGGGGGGGGGWSAGSGWSSGGGSSFGGGGSGGGW